MSSRWTSAHAEDDARDQPREKFTWSADPSHAAIARLSASEMDSFVLAVLTDEPSPECEVVQRTYQAHRELEGSGRKLDDAVWDALGRLVHRGAVRRIQTTSGAYEWHLVSSPESPTVG